MWQVFPLVKNNALSSAFLVFVQVASVGPVVAYVGPSSLWMVTEYSECKSCVGNSKNVVLQFDV